MKTPAVPQEFMAPIDVTPVDPDRPQAAVSRADRHSIADVLSDGRAGQRDSLLRIRDFASVGSAIFYRPDPTARDVGVARGGDGLGSVLRITSVIEPRARTSTPARRPMARVSPSTPIATASVASTCPTSRAATCAA